MNGDEGDRRRLQSFVFKSDGKAEVVCQRSRTDDLTYRQTFDNFADAVSALGTHTDSPGAFDVIRRRFIGFQSEDMARVMALLAAGYTLGRILELVQAVHDGTADPEAVAELSRIWEGLA
jgi:hypothetical protein